MSLDTVIVYPVHLMNTLSARWPPPLRPSQPFYD